MSKLRYVTGLHGYEPYQRACVSLDGVYKSFFIKTFTVTIMTHTFLALVLVLFYTYDVGSGVKVAIFRFNVNVNVVRSSQVRNAIAEVSPVYLRIVALCLYNVA